MVRVAVALPPLLLLVAEALHDHGSGSVALEVSSDGAVRQDHTLQARARAGEASGVMRRQGVRPRAAHPESSAPEAHAAADGEHLWSSNFSAAAVEEAVEATSRLHVPSSANESARHGSVLYVVYSDSQFYDSRLKWVLETWAEGFPSSALVVIGDAAAPASLGARVHQTKCPAHSHWEGACCKYAEAVVLAHKLMQRDPSFSWAYFTDDDAYVRTREMGKALARQSDVNNSHGVALGNFGCAAQECANGLCAGGGYAASSTAVKRLVDGNVQAFLAEQMRNCARCGRWADLAMSQIFEQRGIREEHLAGLNGWQLDKKCFDQSLASSDTEPLMYHYIRSRAQMEFLHGLFTGRNATGSLQGGTLASCAAYRGRMQCAPSALPEDRPWLDAPGKSACAALQAPPSSLAGRAMAAQPSSAPSALAQSNRTGGAPAESNRTGGALAESNRTGRQEGRVSLQPGHR